MDDDDLFPRREVGPQSSVKLQYESVIETRQTYTPKVGPSLIKQTNN